MTGADTRRLAAQLVGRIIDGGAYANVVVRQNAFTDPRDRAFMRRLVFTTVRMLRRVDRAVVAAADRPLTAIDPELRNLLRTGATELLFLRSAPRAAVHTTVSIAATIAPRASGFVNAVLRRLARDGEPPLPTGAEGAALRLGVPDWIYQDLVGQWGTERTERFLEASNQEAPLTIRARRPGFTAGRPVSGIDGAYVVDDPGRLDDLDPTSFTYTDPASVAVGIAMEIRPGDTVVDLAAAPGGKTVHLWDQAGATGLVVALDAHRRRAGSGRDRLRRLGVDVPWVVADAAAIPLREGSVDRMLLDAPCTGLGTLRRRPEIRHRLDRQAPRRLARRQRELLTAALRSRPRRLVYSVCTVFAAETVEVIDGLGGRPPEGIPGERWGDGLLLAPDTTGTDGMFVSVFDR